MAVRRKHLSEFFIRDPFFTIRKQKKEGILSPFPAGYWVV